MHLVQSIMKISPTDIIITTPRDFQMKQHSLLIAGACLLGSHTMADVIFSEYIEGSSNNKAIEIMNTGSDSVDLSQYSIELYSNGNLSVQNLQTLSGTLEAGQVFVLANSSAVDDILDVSDITSSVTFFNGNDVLLLKQNDVVVDRIGQLGNNESFGANVTLVRNDEITSGDPQFDLPFDPTVEWTSYPQNTFTYLGNGDDNGGGGTEPPVDLTCAAEATLISSIQGNASNSPLEGQSVIVEAIVTADLQDSNEMSGFFIQEEDFDADADPMTSEGLFVYHSSDDVSVGDLVRIAAQADEYYSFTQINNVQDLVICSSNNALPTAATLSLPTTAIDFFEAVEGMRVQFNESLTVNEVYNLGRYGEFLASNGRRSIPTDVAAPGPDSDAIAAQNALNSLIVEDGIRSQNPEPVIFPMPGLDAYNTLRVGAGISNLQGVMNYAYGTYKLIPTSAPTFDNANPREDSPQIVEDSDLRLASFNVLNFFNGDGIGGGFPTDRGADTAFELERQTAKLVAAITALDADIVGLMELENDGFDDLSAISELTAAINNQLTADQQYDYVSLDTNSIGDDAIAVGMIYRPERVTLLGQAAVLDSSNSPLDEQGEPLFVDSLNRPALAQSFQHIDSGEILTVAVNHLKSKGSSNCDTNGDCDVGQGAYNIARTNAAEALAIWLAGSPTGVVDSDTVIMGDLNAYSKEDPITKLMENGYSLIKSEGGYSYVFSGETGSLDHVLASTSLVGKVLNVQDWHINTDEPRVLDYNTEFKSETQVQSLFAANPFRSSDHDPVIIDFQFNQAPIAEYRVYPFFFWYIFISESYDPDGQLVSETWQIGDYDIESSWLALPKRFVHRHKIKEVTLTVEDDDGEIASVTHSIR
jgi:predicted extracellular nuclease